VTTIDDVIAAMRAIDARLPDADGVKWFNFLYLSVTETIRAQTAGWHDWPFVERLDVVFAGLYFDALAAWDRDPRSAPRAWRALFERRSDAGLARLQCALAGMNAHINHDLAIALDRVAGLDGRYPARDSDRYRDFSRVNEILANVEASVRAPLATGLIAHADRALGDIDSILAMWNVRKAREAAWTNGEVLWHLRAVPRLQRDYLTKLDLTTSFAGRGLLVPRIQFMGS
jgi:hypothetical protein